MDKDIKICYAYIETEDINSISPSSMRGFFGNSFKNDMEYHHHDEGTSFVYRYPQIQYKKISEKLLIIGLQKYSQDIHIKLSKIEYIRTNQGKKVRINNIEFKTKIIQISQKNMRYSFQSPWIALNSKNFKQFFSGATLSKTKFLENILIGNILSMLKGLNIYIDFKLQASISNIQPVFIYLKKNQFIAFNANFNTNILIPEYIGIGKSVSKGFGTVGIAKDDN